MITPSFSLTATERVLPKLALDFTTASLDPRVTFTRTGNTATVTNSSGAVVAINADLPRFDYNPLTLACKGLLIEEARTNLILYSEALNTGPIWAFGNTTVSADVTTSPAQIQNADKAIETVSTATVHTVQQTFLATSGTTYTCSAYFKKAERGFALVALITAFPTTAIQINLTTGVVTTGTGTPLNAFSQDVGNGWFRVGFSLAANSTITASLNLYISADGLWANRNYVGNGTSGIFIWGAQIEAGAFATSYIPTTTTALTRNADVAKMTGTNFSDWFNASEGAAVIQALPSTINNTRPAIRFDDNTANESIALRSVAADPQLFVVDGGSTQATLDAGTIASNTVYKLAGAWKASSFATAINGAAAVTSASGTLPTVTQARLGSDGTNYLNGQLQTVRYWSQRVIDAEVQAFSK